METDSVCCGAVVVRRVPALTSAVVRSFDERMECSGSDRGCYVHENCRRSGICKSESGILDDEHHIMMSAGATRVAKQPASSVSAEAATHFNPNAVINERGPDVGCFTDHSGGEIQVDHPTTPSASPANSCSRSPNQHRRCYETLCLPNSTYSAALLLVCILHVSLPHAHGFSAPQWGLSTELHQGGTSWSQQLPARPSADCCRRSPFILLHHQQCASPRQHPHTRHTSPLFLYAPPGSGYAGREDEVSALPTTYDPMMEYPGTMRPGRTPENMPFHDLPIGDDDPDPVPWPHLQQISWHHRWEPPHEHPIPIEDFIEMQNRWASPEQEAEMRAGARQSVRERRELQESEKRQMVITDDDDDNLDADDAVEELNVALGEGVFGRLGSDADRAATAIATSPRPGGVDDTTDEDLMGAGQDSDSLDDDGLDFLLDLGLDMLDDDDDDAGADRRSPATMTSLTRSGTVSPRTSSAKVGDDDDDDEDVEFDDEDVTPSSAISVEVDDDDDDVIDFGADDDDDVVGVDDDDDMDSDGGGTGSGLDEVSLDDYGDNDGLDNDIFDEGGFDYDDYDNDNDGGDMW